MCTSTSTDRAAGVMSLYLLTCSCRLGVIEEEREEDERKLNVAVAAVERMNVLVSYHCVFIYV